MGGVGPGEVLRKACYAGTPLSLVCSHACTGEFNSMPPKPKPLDHPVDGVRCRIYQSGLIKVAVGDKGNEFPVSLLAKSTADLAACETKVRAHPRFTLLSRQRSAYHSSTQQWPGPTEENAALCVLCSPACTTCLISDDSSYADLLVLPGGRFVCECLQTPYHVPLRVQL